MPLLPPPDISNAYVDDERRPSKDFYNWIKSFYDFARLTLAGGSMTVGSSPIIGGTTGHVLYDNAGLLGELPVTGTGSVVESVAPILSSVTTDPLHAVNFQKESGNTESIFARNVITTAFPGSHVGNKDSTFHIETRPVGGGASNPTVDASLTLSTVKQNVATTTVLGEIDSAYICTTQGGADGGGSDCSGILYSTVHIGSCGTASMWEGQTSHFDRGTGLADKTFNCIAGLNIPPGLGAQTYGFNVDPILGMMDYGYYVGPNQSNVPAVFFPFYYYGGSALRIFGVGQNAEVETTGSFGYANLGPSGVGGVVTQLTSKATAVQLDKICGQIITTNSAMTASTTVSFQVVNALVAATDTVVLNIKSGGSPGNYAAVVSTVSAGSFWVTIISFVNASDALTLNFAILKAVNT